MARVKFAATESGGQHERRNLSQAQHEALDSHLRTEGESARNQENQEQQEEEQEEDNPSRTRNQDSEMSLRNPEKNVDMNEEDFIDSLQKLLGVEDISEETAAVVSRVVNARNPSLLNAALFTSLLEGFHGLKGEVTELRAQLARQSGISQTSTSGTGLQEFEKVAILLIQDIIRKAVVDVMIDAENPRLCFRTIKDVVIERVSGLLLSGVVAGSVDYLGRIDSMAKVIRYKCDAMHQMIGRWVCF